MKLLFYHNFATNTFLLCFCAYPPPNTSFLFQNSIYNIDFFSSHITPNIAYLSTQLSNLSGFYFLNAIPPVSSPRPSSQQHRYISQCSYINIYIPFLIQYCRHLPLTSYVGKPQLFIKQLNKQTQFRINRKPSQKFIGNLMYCNSVIHKPFRNVRNPCYFLSKNPYIKLKIVFMN